MLLLFTFSYLFLLVNSTFLKSAVIFWPQQCVPNVMVLRRGLFWCLQSKRKHSKKCTKDNSLTFFRDLLTSLDHFAGFFAHLKARKASYMQGLDWKPVVLQPFLRCSIELCERKQKQKELNYVWRLKWTCHAVGRRGVRVQPPRSSTDLRIDDAWFLQIYPSSSN